MVERIDCEKGVVRRFTVKGPGGLIDHIVWYSQYNPEQFVGCTKMSEGNTFYLSGAIHKEASIVFSCLKEAETTRVFSLSISGGDKSTQQEIINAMREQLGIEAEQRRWLSISPEEVAQRDMFRWKVHLA